MTKNYGTYQNPLVERYSSQEMLEVFSPDRKFRAWRQLWVALAEAEKELGLPVTQAQVQELRANMDDVNHERAEELEKRLRHDVMAHVHAFGLQCPKARPIIHLGATSAFVTDNADMIVMRSGMQIILDKLISIIGMLAHFAAANADVPALGYTHFQPAQLTTVGKRACLWLQEVLIDYHEISRVMHSMRFLGTKGATGTQASFLELFEGNHTKVARLDELIAQKMRFPGVLTITGQTYTRKIDVLVLNALSGVAQSASKFGTDLRLLQGLGEMSEPFGQDQIGSSAMAYKRNPMRCERMCSLGRFVIVSVLNAPLTAAAQWLERTLDDSANRRLAIAETFLAVDAILNVYLDVVRGMRVNAELIRRRVAEELPFIATETILMRAVRAGGDRQTLHEKLRRHSIAAADVGRKTGKNDLVERLQADKAFSAAAKEIRRVLDPARSVGRAPQQVKQFLEQEVKPLLSRFSRRPRRAPQTELKV
ncbi:MAG: adenylosuccinate lyase [Planctomycetota bacterium]|nr:adenylosuccinate lyase [Planctomycetota bacterium]